MAVNSRVRNAIGAAFENDGALKHLFTKVLGFEICNVRSAILPNSKCDLLVLIPFRFEWP